MSGNEITSERFLKFLSDEGFRSNVVEGKDSDNEGGLLSVNFWKQGDMDASVVLFSDGYLQKGLDSEKVIQLLNA